MEDQVLETGTEEVVSPQTDIDTNEQTNTGDVTGTQQMSDAEVVEQQKQKQTQEQNRAFAQMRREAQEAKRKADELEQWKRDFEQKNNAQQQRQLQADMDAQREKLAAELEEQGFPVSQINKYLKMDPVFQQMQEELNANKQQLEQERHLRNRQEAEQQFVKDHAYLRSKYGDIVPDLNNLDQATVDMLYGGMPLRSAWLTANEDAIAEALQKKAAHKAIKQVGSKAHLGTEKSNDSTDLGTQVSLSAEQMKTWKSMFPGETEAQLKKRAAKYVKKK